MKEPQALWVVGEQETRDKHGRPTGRTTPAIFENGELIAVIVGKDNRSETALLIASAPAFSKVIKELKDLLVELSVAVRFDSELGERIRKAVGK